MRGHSCIIIIMADNSFTKGEAKAPHIEKRNAALKSAETPESRELI
jgi:hypothetical protein